MPIPIATCALAFGGAIRKNAITNPNNASTVFFIMFQTSMLCND
jgi:hypothetical protein